MHYSELVLDLPLDDAAVLVSRTVDGLSRTRDEGTITYRTNSGTIVAKLVDVSDESTPGVTRLRYRTTMVSPSMASARTTAREIRNALAEHRV